MPPQKSDDQGVWLEVALNGAAGRQYQPNIPITIDDIIAEGVACATLGAAIIHVHAYDDYGQPVEDARIYAKIIEGIRREIDVIVYPTLALAGSVEDRFGVLEALGRDGLLDFCVVDPGSVNITHRLQVAMGASGFVYSNPDGHIREGLRLAEENGWRPAFAIYEPGFARLGAALSREYPRLKKPIFRIMFSDNLLFGLAPSDENLAFYARHLGETAPDMPWMVSGLDADISSLIGPSLDFGFHLRVGLEDAPFGAAQTNSQLVERATSQIKERGFRLATSSEIRAGA